MSIFDTAKELKDALDKAELTGSRWDSIREMADFVLGRQWNCKEFPVNEEDVLVIVETKYKERWPQRRVLRAFYEDGKMKEWNSGFGWALKCGKAEEDEDGDLLVPRGWYEISDYGEEITEITDDVIGWQPMLDPWEGAEGKQ